MAEKETENLGHRHGGIPDFNARADALHPSGAQAIATQTLTWDAQNRLIRVVQLDGSNNGSLWTAVYDGLGRRLASAQQTVSGGSLTGSPTVIASIYDPQTAREIGVSVNGAKAWKVYGNSGLLEATIVDATRATKGVLSDQFGNGVASVSGSTVTWYTTRCGAYGPLPGIAAQPLTDVTLLAEASAWHGYYMDGTGFYHFGRRYYDPVSGRWLSCDPLGFAASTSLYEFCANDPLNSFDPSGCCPQRNNDDDGSFNYPLSYNSGGGFGPGPYGQNPHDPNAMGFISLGYNLTALFNFADDMPGSFDNPYNGWIYGGYVPNEFATTNGMPRPSFAVNMDSGQIANLSLNYGIQNLGLMDFGLGEVGGMVAGKALGAAFGMFGRTVDSALAPLSDLRISPLGNGSPVAQTVDLSLTYKMGWTAEQIAAANAKVAALNEADLVVTPVERSGTSAASMYRASGASIPSGSDIDHTIDLQLNGLHTLSNLAPLDSSVNRSLGAQIYWQTKDLPAGTPINSVTIGQ